MVTGLESFKTVPSPPSLMSMTVNNIGSVVVAPMIAKEVSETRCSVLIVISTIGHDRSRHSSVVVSAIMTVHWF